MVAHVHFALDLGQADAADARRGVGEVLVDEGLVEADGFEDLRAAIGLDRGDAHLGHHLHETLVHGLDEITHRRLVQRLVALAALDGLLLQDALLDEVVEGLECEVGVHGVGAITDQRREMVHFARGTGLDQEAHAHAAAVAHQVVVRAGGREQRRNRRVLCVHAPIGQDDEGVALVDCAVRFLEHAFERGFEPGNAVGDAVQRRDGLRLEAGHLDMADARDVLVVEDRRLQLQAAAAFLGRFEQVALRADRGRHLGYQLFADAVQRRVRDLREQLLEVVVEHARAFRQHGERSVGTHRTYRFLALFRHRQHQDAQVLVRVTVGLLTAEHGVVVDGMHVVGHRQACQRHVVLREPFPVGVLVDVALLQFGVVDDAASLGVDEEDAAWMQAFLDRDVFRREVEHADFGRHDDHVVLGHVVARRAQAIAVEHRAHDAAVGERDAGRAIPRFHQATVIFIEGLARGIHLLVPAPGLRNHHQHRERQRAAGHVQEFEHLVEGRGVRTPFDDDREKLLQVFTEHGRFAQGFARPHPVRVAAQRVDLAVVRDVAKRVRERPGREGVRREALVHERHCALDQRVRQVGELLLDLHRVQHALVDDRAMRKGRDVEQRRFAHRRAPDRVLDALADQVELAFEGIVVGDIGGAADEDLLEIRLTGFGGRADGAVVHRQDAPAQQGLAFLGDDAREFALAGCGFRGVGRQEHEAGAVMACGRERDADLCAFTAQEGVRDLDQDARAVAGIHFGAAGAAMLEMLEDRQRSLDRRVRFSTLDVDHEPDATSVVFCICVIETSLRPALVRELRARTRHRRASCRYNPLGQG